MKSNHRFVILVLLLVSLTALACSAGAVTEWFATPTPTPTNTPTATLTPTVTPTATPTETPSPTLTPTPQPTGITADIDADGNVLLADYDNNYKFTLPSTWIVIPLSGQDMTELVNKLAETNPEFKDAANTFQSLDPDFVRVVALNKDSKYISKGFASNITVVAIQDKLLSSMPIEFTTGAFEESMKQNGAKVITQGVNTVTSDSGVEIGIIEVEQQAPTATGSKIAVRLKIIIFVVGDKLIMVNLTAPSQLMAELSLELDTIAKSVELIKP